MCINFQLPSSISAFFDFSWYQLVNQFHDSFFNLTRLSCIRLLFSVLSLLFFFFEKQMLYNTNSIAEEETAKQGSSKRTTSQHKPTWSKLEPIEKQQQVLGKPWCCIIRTGKVLVLYRSSNSCCIRIFFCIILCLKYYIKFKTFVYIKNLFLIYSYIYIVFALFFILYYIIFLFIFFMSYLICI